MLNSVVAAPTAAGRQSGLSTYNPTSHRPVSKHASDSPPRTQSRSLCAAHRNPPDCLPLHGPRLRAVSLPTVRTPVSRADAPCVWPWACSEPPVPTPPPSLPHGLVLTREPFGPESTGRAACRPALSPLRPLGGPPSWPGCRWGAVQYITEPPRPFVDRLLPSDFLVPWPYRFPRCDR